MEINLGAQRVVLLRAVYSPEEVRELALAKRVDAFGQLAKLFQRPKAEDIEITAIQKRLEPFWFAAATARYSYDRRHTYRVPVSPEVRSVTVYENEHQVAGERNPGFEVEAIEHCVEEPHVELLLDAATGQEAALGAYLKYPGDEVPDMAALENEGVDVDPPEVRGSFVVHKVAAQLMRTFQADKVHEERIDVEEVTLYYRPTYAVEYLWKPKQKKQVVDIDALTGEGKPEAGELKKHVTRVLANDALFDIGADTVGAVIPGANIAIKLGRLAARRAIR